MRYLALAVDYDGTLASDGQVAAPTVAALRRLAATGRKLVLVTGRQLDELVAIFPEIGVFDRVVAENGALLYCPATREQQPLAKPPPFAFVRELKRRGVDPLAVGKTIVATVKPNETAVLAAIRDLGLELQVIFNKRAVMVLPASVNKASGLAAALRALGLSARNAVAIGDAENDHALLRSAEYGVAVANAVPMLQRDADRTSTRDHGAAVIELVEQLIADDLRSAQPRAPRRRVLLGTRADGREANIAAAWTSLLVAGASGSGKSTLATGVLERLRAEGYQFCVIDPEGDYEGLADAIVFGSAERGPTAAEVLTALENPDADVVVNLVGLPLGDRPAFFLALLPRLQALRAKAGRPHWILVDEAHHLLPRESDPAPAVVTPDLTGMIYVTVHPDAVAPSVLQTIDAIAALGDAPDAAIRQFAAAALLDTPLIDGERLEQGEALLWLKETGKPAVKIKIAPSHLERRRHRRKYAQGELPPDRSFYFRGPNGKLNLRAQNLMLFVQVADGVDDETWLHHLRQRDYSRWMRSCIKDEALAGAVARVEAAYSANAAESRARIRAAVEEHYTLPAAGARAD
jgi:hydroxymethylpyrimidine pyrophosphatase-like HAD family hydrolase